MLSFKEKLMRYIKDIIQEIDDVVRPIEQTLKIMLEHHNVKPESKAKVQSNLGLLDQLREKYPNAYGIPKEVPR